MRGMHAARWPCFRSPPTRTASGLTLLEVLVVFVLASLVGTLLVQGTGFFLGQYDSVKRIGREASSDAMQQRWFASTVHAMVPYLAEDRRFVGDSEFFQGVTVQPLRVRSGIPVAARWSIVPGEEGTAVLYAEQPSPCPSDARGDNRTAPRAPRSVERDTHPASAVKGLADVACGAGTTPFEDTHWTVLESADRAGLRVRGLGSRLARPLARRRRGAGVDSPPGQAGHIRWANRVDRELRPAPRASRQSERLQVTRFFWDIPSQLAFFLGHPSRPSR